MDGMMAQIQSAFNYTIKCNPPIVAPHNQKAKNCLTIAQFFVIANLLKALWENQQ
jgi:hypothetical protein